jgi:hypothetical protein
MQLNAQSRHLERLPAGQVGDGDLPRTYISIPETRSKRQLGDRIGESGDGSWMGNAFGAMHEEASTG